ncbi:MAG TPA: phosphopyruvate hydratase [Candidatus Sulfotelmatobacter sp.]|nr:phosphopyruvate hydratase [Candidatus Sulfotelmatobacter sp.]
MPKIVSLDALEILDSRGNPTIQVSARLDSGTTGIAKVPSGASTGKNEAVELRDGDPKRYAGKGVRKAVENVLKIIQPAVAGMDATDQRALDEKLIALDGTPNKARLGANSLLGVSIAAAKASAAERKQPLYRYLAQRDSFVLPVPMFNVLNGGRHADNNVDFQEFMIAPIGASTFAEALQSAAETFHALKDILHKKGYETSVGDEGGFAPRLRSNEEPMELLESAIHKAGYRVGSGIAINLDPAASEFYEKGSYLFRKSDQSKKSSDDMIRLWSDWLERYPEIHSLEDGLAEEDWDGWAELTRQLGRKVQLVGDDIFVTNPEIFAKGIQRGIANSILIKLNQIGTVTETLRCIEVARGHGYTAVISHRSGETDDTTIADFAVATDVEQIKTGSVCRGERISKYNRLLEIEHELGKAARYAGASVYSRWKQSRGK